MPPLRIVFFGTSSFAIPALRELLGSGHTLLCAVSRPPRPAGRGRRPAHPPVYRFIREHFPGLQVHQPAKLSRDFTGSLAGMGPDVMVTASYGAWLPESLLDASVMGVVNIHPSLLPLYRGAAPVTRAILDCREETGVSFMLTDSGWDTGPVIASYPEPIRPDDTAGTLESRLAALSGERVVSVLEGFQRGMLRPVPQTGEPLYARKIEVAETWLDWTERAECLERRIRAFQPSPGARTSHRGRILKIEAARLSSVTAEPGGVTVREGSLIVGCGGDDSLEILRLQPASRSSMSSGEFLRGARMGTGERFEGP